VPTPSPLASAITLALLGYAAWYCAVCVIAPFHRHRPCHGTGKRLTRIRHRVTRCRRCRGTGRALRYGRRAWNRLHAEHHTGTHTPAPPLDQHPPARR
jgi:hypothetical protein